MTQAPARWRRRLPLADMRGDVLITDAALDASARLLPTYRGPDGDHEGIVFLLGLELGPLTVITTALAPNADHARGRVICNEIDIAAAARAARTHQLGLLGQLHSHPTDETEHSIGDDSLVVMPFEGMLSIVAPWYGRVGLRPLDGLGVHQFQDGRWVAIRPESIREHLRIVPDSLDTR